VNDVTDAPDSPAMPGRAVLELVAVMDRLRSPGGCPWDARQTHESLVEYLVEEAYETVEAIEARDDAGLREELGDLLLQVVFHARIAQEGDPGWNIDDVAQGIVDKLIRRHPHVFADVDARTAEQVEANWHALKAQEKGRSSVTDGIPEHLPALLRAAKVHARSASVGEQLPSPSAIADAESILSTITTEQELGELLLSLAFGARERDWDAEGALRQAVRRRIDVIRSVEQES
jgi:XTP/dITP diphosphohydrolase